MPVGDQSRLLGITLDLYWEIYADVVGWLEVIEMDDQLDRVTDTRLTEWLPPNARVYCSRCYCALETVPCATCLVESGEGVEFADHDAWGLLRSGPFPDPPYATTAPPGSLRKIETMRRRALMGFGVFHPDDVGREMEIDDARLP